MHDTSHSEQETALLFLAYLLHHDIDAQMEARDVIKAKLRKMRY
jgi:hypothetical protein